MCSAEVLLFLPDYVPCLGNFGWCNVYLRERQRLRLWGRGRSWTDWQILQLGSSHSQCVSPPPSYPSPSYPTGARTLREPWELVFPKDCSSLLWDWGMWGGNIQGMTSLAMFVITTEGLQLCPTVTQLPLISAGLGRWFANKATSEVWIIFRVGRILYRFKAIFCRKTSYSPFLNDI